MTASFQAELDEIRTLETLDSLEFKSQVVLVGFAVATAWIAMGLGIFVVWYVFHYSMVVAEKLLLSWQHRSKAIAADWRFYGLILFVNALIGFTFSALPVYLWSMGEDIYQLSAMAMLVGATLNTSIIRSRNWQVMVCYMVPNGLAFASVAYLIIAQKGLGVEAAVAAIVTLCILIYFGVSVKESYRAHRAHACALEQLAHTQRAEALGTLAGGIAHDFNNLLNVISGNLELLRDDVRDPQNNELITQSLRAVERGANITAQLLALGGKSHLRPKAMDLTMVFIELEHMLNRLLPKSLHLEIKADPGVPFVLVDEAALQTALINLAVNARDAMGPAGTLSIRATALQPGAGAGGSETANRVRITVSDNGTGIAPEIVSRVTEPFFTTKQAGEGSGLGLAMVQAFVAQSSGHLDIQNRLPRGTVISITLPAAVGQDAPAPRQEPTLPLQPPTGRVLVVEDEAQLRALICQRLRIDGFEIEDAGDGESALQKIASGFTPDVLVTDIVMPGPIQGDQLIEEVRRIHPGLPVIAMSGYARVMTPRSAQEPLGDIFLQKPVPLSAISQAVQGFVGRTIKR